MECGVRSMGNLARELFDEPMSRTWDITTTAGILGCGLIGGVFFTFSAFVMSGLNRLPARQAPAAMQSINVTAQHPPLMLALFGTAIVCGALIYRAIKTWGNQGAALLLAGAALYLIGAILVTVAINVPLNNQLAALSIASPATPAHWQHFLTSWTLANHARTVLSLAGAALLVTAVLRGAPAASPGHQRPSATAAPTSPHHDEMMMVRYGHAHHH
jgi:uncharacterized membrane protein